MNTIKKTVSGLTAAGLLAGLAGNFLAFGDTPPATTQPTTGPSPMVAVAPTTGPVLAGGPRLSNAFADPTPTVANPPRMTSINGETGSDSARPVADVQIGAGVGVGFGQVTPNSAVRVPHPVQPVVTPTTMPTNNLNR